MRLSPKLCLEPLGGGSQHFHRPIGPLLDYVYPSGLHERGVNTQLPTVGFDPRNSHRSEYRYATATCTVIVPDKHSLIIYVKNCTVYTNSVRVTLWLEI